jgi:Lrp/AsnC family transcriptional regulator, leucine-responsive regulatory protein
MEQDLKILGKQPWSPDEIDIRLIIELQRDAKSSLQSLGAVVGLSAPSVMERVRKLEEVGVITGYHALVDARKIGVDIAAFIGVSINSPARLAEFEHWVGAEPQVLECHHVTGSHSLMLKVRARNTAALEKLISRVRSVEGVERTETMLVLSTYAERTQIPLDLGDTTMPLKKSRLRRKLPQGPSHQQEPASVALSEREG